jgi:hypothetical protein
LGKIYQPLEGSLYHIPKSHATGKDHLELAFVARICYHGFLASWRKIMIVALYIVSGIVIVLALLYLLGIHVAEEFERHDFKVRQEEEEFRDWGD